MFFLTCTSRLNKDIKGRDHLLKAATNNFVHFKLSSWSLRFYCITKLLLSFSVVGLKCISVNTYFNKIIFSPIFKT